MNSMVCFIDRSGKRHEFRRATKYKKRGLTYFLYDEKDQNVGSVASSQVTSIFYDKRS